jgi:hypothetical protein
VSNRVTLLVRDCVRKYYDYWLVCDDHTCHRRTKQQSVLGYACTENCHGRMVQVHTTTTTATMLDTCLNLLNTLTTDVMASCVCMCVLVGCHQEYDDSALHNQLKFMESLFDVPRALRKRNLDPNRYVNLWLLIMSALIASLVLVCMCMCVVGLASPRITKRSSSC